MTHETTLKYFTPDGISGLERKGKERSVSASLALKIGYVIGKKYRVDEKSVVVVGKATARPAYMIENALTAGLLSTGMNVRLLGPMPTPAIGMLVRSLRAVGGIMISSGNRPYKEVTVKVFDPDGRELSCKDAGDIDSMLNLEIPEEQDEDLELGKAQRIDGPDDRYIEYAKRTLSKELTFSGLRVVVDCANGATYKVVPVALNELGIEVVAINHEPDGFNINRECGFNFKDPAVLAKMVHHVRADIGFAFDGDGGKVLVMDEQKNVFLPEDVEAILVRGKHECKKSAELNGSATGDGLVTALQVLAVVRRSGMKASKLVESLRPQQLRAAS